MNALTPIPIPPAQRWHEFKVKALPLIVVVGMLGTVVFLWRGYVSPPTLVGEVEPVQAKVASTQPGTLLELRVTRLQPVKSGDPLAQVLTTDPKILSARLAVIRAEVELLRAGMAPVVDQQRNALDYERLRLDWLKQKVELATAQVNLQLANAEYRRTIELNKEQIISDSILDQARTTKDSLQSEVDARTRLVAEAEQGLERLRTFTGADDQTAQPDSLMPIQAAIGVQMAKLQQTEAELSPVVLTSPIDGTVSMIYRRSGETIMAGEPVLTISALGSGRIVGYLRQPIPDDVKIGAEVEVRTRAARRAVHYAKVLQIGSQLEPIATALLRPGMTYEVGLPILVNVPPDLELRPGELVDLTLQLAAD